MNIKKQVSHYVPLTFSKLKITICFQIIVGVVPNDGEEDTKLTYGLVGAGVGVVVIIAIIILIIIKKKKNKGKHSTVRKGNHI